MYKSTRKTNHINSVLQKNVECRNIKHASTEIEYDESVKKTFSKYQDIVNFIQTKSGTSNECVVLCNIKCSDNPVKYTVVKGGPLDIKEGRKFSSRSESSDFMCFGPVYTSFHSDFGYPHRNSLIPSWNVGVVKFWIIRKECDSKTQRNAPTSTRRKKSPNFSPLDELNQVFKYPADYQLLIQQPGQIVRHNGKHVHCVITAIDIKVNPSRLSLSLGRKDYYPEDSYAFASSTTETLVASKKGDLQLVGREAFIQHQLTDGEHKVLKRRIIADESRRTSRRKRRGGFKTGNKFYALKKPRTVCEPKSY